MAFSSTTSLIDGTNHFHDFVSGPFSIPVSLTLGYEAFNVNFNDCSTSAPTISVTDYYGNSAINGGNSSYKCGYGIAASSDGTFASVIVGIPALAGVKLTKINWGQLGINSAFIGNLTGPYTLTYTSPGVKNPLFLLYKRKNNQWHPGSFTPALPYPQIGAEYKSFAFTIHQIAVSITNRGSSAGLELIDGTTVSNMDTFTNNTIILNKSNNRGDSVTSEWKILKQVNGVYIPATAGVDYSVTGILPNADEITLVWVTPGNYRVVNKSVGTGGVSNTDSNIVNFSVGQSIIDTITLPNVNTLVTAIVAYNNTVVSTTPLTGVDAFSFTVEGVVNVASASWNQRLNADPVGTLLILSDDAWYNELTSRCNIRCKIKQGTTTLQTFVGLGPHTFIRDVGVYSVGFEITPKPGNVIIQSSLGEAQPVLDGSLLGQ